MEQTAPRTPRLFDRGRMRLCAFDLDGTLLNGSEPVRPTVVSMLQRLRAAGITAVISSGRNATQIAPSFAALFAFIIGSNGAFIIDTASGQTVSSHPMERETVLQALDLLAPFDARVFVQQGRTMIAPAGTLPCVLRQVRPGRGMLRDLAERLKVFYGGSKPCLSLRRRAANDGDPFYKLQVFFPDVKNAPAAAKALEPLGLTVLVMEDGSLEITAAGVTKANGVAELAARLGLTEANVCAFGDSANDTGLLKRAGYAVVMGNAEPGVKALADTVAPPVWEDGAAQAAMRLFFQLEE